MYFVQISDTHYLNDYNTNPDFFHDAFLNLGKTREKLKKLKEEVTVPLSFLLHCGDICHYGEKEDYLSAKAILEEVFPDVPLICTTGNHDKRALVQEVFYGETPETHPIFAHIDEIQGLRVISFDNTNTRAGVGEVGDAMCRWILSKLEEKSMDTLLMCHHHCVENQNPMISAPLSPLFQEILEKKEVLALVTGHTHCVYEDKLHSTPYFTVGSMSFRTEALGEGKMDVFDSSFCNVFSYESGKITLESTKDLGFTSFLGQVQRPQ